QSLLPERRPGVAADGRRRRRIVEPDIRRVDVDDDELRRPGGGGGGGGDEGRGGEDQARETDSGHVAMPPLPDRIVFDETEEFRAFLEREDALRFPGAAGIRARQHHAVKATVEDADNRTGPA